MATIRAYKLAEELGIERSEFVEKASALGIVLKSAMAQIEDDVANELRDKLGQRKQRGPVVERRVEQKSGAAVIRRRKKAEEPEPIAEAAPEPMTAAAHEAAAMQPVPEPIAEPEFEAEPEPAAPAESAPTVAEAATTAAASHAGGAAAREREVPTDIPQGGSDRGGAAGAARPGRGQRKLVREVVNLREQERLARQATGRTVVRRPSSVDPRTAASPRRRRRDVAARAGVAQPAVAAKESRKSLRISGDIAVGELARLLGAKAPDVQRKLMALGMMVSINQSIDIETTRKVAAQYDADVQDVGFKEEAFFEEKPAAGADTSLPMRPPVVTVMGHVDHGKTSLLDAIRHANVVEGEAGGITQHIGAYQARVGDHLITFIDTPGHAAFTEMRARGARVTDIVVLVVAATEGIMPQTVEAIEHAKAAGAPIVVAINKIDLPGANSAQTKQRLMEHGLVPEDFGGETICVDVSATKRTGLEKLLEMIQLQAEVLELRSDPEKRASGIVLEAQLDKGRGPVATVLVQQGTLRPGDTVVAGVAMGRVRAMEDERGRRLDAAGPSVPVQVTGLDRVPDAGEQVHAVESERVAKDIVSHREGQRREGGAEASAPKRSLEEIFARAEGGGVKELQVVIKADTRGSVEALRDALLKLSRDEVKVDVLLAGVGAVTESDVMLAKASGAVVVAFHVRPEPAARRAAEGQGVDVRTYQIIYEVVDDIRKAMEGLLPPTISETFGGRAEVRQTFSVPKMGTIAGSYVSEGSIRRGSLCRLIRDGVQIYEGKVGSLKRFKDDAREVNAGFECGIGIDGYNDVKVGDVIETYALKEERPTLE
jgi:translation initiation factor IF-2